MLMKAGHACDLATSAAAVLLSWHDDVHRHDGRGHTRYGRPVQTGNAVAVSNSQIMVYGLTLCATCHQQTRR